MKRWLVGASCRNSHCIATTTGRWRPNSAFPQHLKTYPCVILQRTNENLMHGSQTPAWCPFSTTELRRADDFLLPLETSLQAFAKNLWHVLNLGMQPPLPVNHAGQLLDDGTGLVLR